jgi:diguanylate cyclase (GGDEF)-like protein
MRGAKTATVRRPGGSRGARLRAFARRGLLAGLLALGTPALADAPAAAAARPWQLEGQLAFVHMDSVETAAVNAIAQDPQGFLWFGTQSNLLRWDGYQFHTYARNPDAPGSLPDNYIRSLLVDARGRLWVGTNAGGLSRYDPETDSFVSYPVGAGGTSDGTIRVLVSDRHGGLWIGTGHGVDHLDGATLRIDPPAAGRREDAVTALVLDRNGTLWAGTRTGLLRRGPLEREFAPFAVPAPEGDAPVIRALLEDRAGRLWIGLDLNGAFILDPGATTPRRLLENPDAGTPLVEAVSAIAEVDDGEVWLGTSERGIVRVDTRSWRTRREQRDPARARGLAANQIDSLFMDRDGMMWVGARTTLSNVDPRQRVVQTFFGGHGPGLVVHDDSVSSLLALPDGRVWMSLPGGGIEIVDPVAGPVATIRADPDHAERALPKPPVIGMARWTDGTVFLATAAGLYRASADGREIERLRVPTFKDTLDSRALLVADGYLWVGGLDGLLKLGIPARGGPTLLHRWDGELGDPRVRTLVQGRGADIWIGTMSGVAHLDTATSRVAVVRSDPRDPERLPGGYASSLLTDRKGRLWVATFGRGIEVEKGRDAAGEPTFRRLTQDEGLPQNSVDAMLEDDAGNIWASTDGGLARIETESLRIRAFRTEQGVGIDGFFTANAARTPAGELLFGGLNGFVVVHPERLTRASAAPAMVVTDVRIGGRSAPALRSSPGAVLAVGPNDRSLAVDFAALDFVDPELRRYSYRLAGFDGEWVETPASRRVAVYTNLPPGDYTLELRSAAPGEPWSKPLDIPVHVQPAWYEYRTVRALATLLALALVAALVQLRTRYLRQRQAELEAIVAERTLELRRNQEYLESMAYVDVLTGLPNRRVFNENLRRLIAGCERGQGDFVLLLIDLDGFKAVNDTDGHDVGDAVLVEVAARLRTLIRETDLATRLGGDEFGLVLAQPQDKAAVDSVCARIVRRLGEPIALADHTTTVGASIGVAKVSGGHATPDQLFKAADLAMYEAKRAGRNTWRWDRNSAAAFTMMASGAYDARKRAG